MSIFKVIIILFVFSISSKLAYSDELLIKKQYEGSQKVEFSRYDKGHYKNTNIILQKISRANGKLRVFTSYQINYGLDVNVKEVSKDSLIIQLYLNELSLQGDINYRDFVIDDMLVPSHLSLVISLDNENHFFEFNPEIPDSTTEKRTLLHSKPVNITINNDSVGDITFDEVFFYYDETALRNFKSREKAMHSYYEANEQIDFIAESLEELSFEKPVKIITEGYSLCAAERMFWQIYHAPFRNMLNLEEKDPVGFKSRFEPLKDSVIYYRQLFNDYHSKLDELYYNEGLKKIKNDNLQAAIDNFKRAVVYNPAHVPSHFSMTDVYLKKEHLDSASNVIGKVISELHPQDEYYDTTMIYIDKIFDQYKENVDSLITNERFTGSLNILDKAYEFFNDITQVDYSDELHGMFTKSHTGIFESYLQVIDRSLTVINHSYTISYIEHAIDYKQKYSRYVEDGERVYDYLSQLYEKLMLAGRKSYIQKDFEGAEAYFDYVLQLCEQFPGLECKENVSEYLAISKEARKQEELVSFEIAIRDSLPKMKEEYVLDQVEEEIIDGLAYGHIKAWLGETDEALRILENLKEKSEFYGLREDSLINAQLVSFSKRIREINCELAEKDFDELINQYYELINQKEFVGAYKKLVKAEQIYNENEDCVFDIETVYKEKKKYHLCKSLYGENR